ncbi:hypothetical protein [Ruegeria atlantica]|uniref:hypothetical protein n=1 Tax=Ruegeria atlantica TaxID=81569 RepID=UPI00147E4165|nr:hypothetical protein [Ruegeria atlantica]
MTRATQHRASVRQTRHAITTIVHKAPMQDDFLPPRSWVRASHELFFKMLLLRPDARRVLAVLLSQMTMNKNKVDLTQTQIVQLANKLADACNDDDPVHDLRMLTLQRVCRAAADLKKADIATYSKRGGFWTINPFVVQFGNVLNDPALSAIVAAQNEDDVLFPEDNGQQPVCIEDSDTHTDTDRSRGEKEVSR